MKLITKNTDYAIRAILYLAENNTGFVSSSEISLKQRIPLYFLRRILQALLKEEFIISKEGVKGGVKLSLSPDRIKVTDIIKVFQDEIKLLDCIVNKKICYNHKTCPLRKRILKIEEVLIKELNKINIFDLVSDRYSGKK